MYPKKVFAVFSALLQDYQIFDASLQVKQPIGEKTSSRQQDEMLQHPIPFAGTDVQIFSDAAWTSSPDGQLQQAGLGIHIQLWHHHASSIYVAAMSPPVGSPLQAEAYGPNICIFLNQLKHPFPNLFNSIQLNSTQISSISLSYVNDSGGLKTNKNETKRRSKFMR